MWRLAKPTRRRCRWGKLRWRGAATHTLLPHSQFLQPPPLGFAWESPAPWVLHCLSRLNCKTLAEPEWHQPILECGISAHSREPSLHMPPLPPTPPTPVPSPPPLPSAHQVLEAATGDHSHAVAAAVNNLANLMHLVRGRGARVEGGGGTQDHPW